MVPKSSVNGYTLPERGGGAKTYVQLLTHGLVLDEKGKKMSKSLRKIIPVTIVYDPAYGYKFLML
ncbi:hypothetical protein D9619_010659 [Psilocybe cf. subviscida]|uniref:Aminoacyl-tRNA synthetase class Ia domain-containing protein n=1 Tax=Psilocybe cf. subviscida TaxID=2480587 RepID=A0A8H5B8E1_9AGAR|nr:hypothetical protein D9619_010659 [Psilocybe cf. subviscida]